MLEILEWTDKSVGYAGFSLGVGDRRILHLPRRILWLNLAHSLKELRSFIIILLLLYTILLLLQVCIWDTPKI